MALSIRLIPDPFQDPESGVLVSYGSIEIGTFNERFLASLVYWRPNDYKHHWNEALTRIVSSSDVSCLITSIVDPSTASHLFWWPMYRGDTVYIQHQILFFKNLSSPFNESDPFSSVPKRQRVDEDGNRISEWAVSIKEIEAFLKRGALVESNL